MSTRIPLRILLPLLAVLCLASSLFAQQTASPVIRLNAGVIDTGTAQAQARRQTLAAQTGKQLHLIQFSGPIQASWPKQLADQGLQIINYIPDNAYLVYGDASSLRTMQTRATGDASVRWEGRE